MASVKWAKALRQKPTCSSVRWNNFSSCSFRRRSCCASNTRTFESDPPGERTFTQKTQSQQHASITSSAEQQIVINKPLLQCCCSYCCHAEPFRQCTYVNALEASVHHQSTNNSKILLQSWHTSMMSLKTLVMLTFFYPFSSRQK